MRRKLAAVLISAGVVALSAAGIAVAERVQIGKIVLDIDGGFTPTTLPKKTFAPITLQADADITTTDGTVPQVLKQVILEFDRNGRIVTNGLSVCQPSQLENTVPDVARSTCKNSIVGTGFANALVTFPDQAPIPANSPLTIFNGPKIGGNPSVIIHAYTTVPAPTTFVIQSAIARGSGRYRYRVVTDVPPIAGGYGAVTHFDFKIHKIFKSKGKKTSYAQARCADGRLQAQGTFTFADGSSAMGSVFRPCKARG